jgi:hypothetical protein
MGKKIDKVFTNGHDDSYGKFVRIFGYLFNILFEVFSLDKISAVHPSYNQKRMRLRKEKKNNNYRKCEKDSHVCSCFVYLISVPLHQKHIHNEGSNPTLNDL